MQTFKLNSGQCLIVFQSILICVLASSGENDFEELYDTLLARSTPPEVIHENAVQIIKQMMNLSVDPCEDFYEFSCGNFEKVNKYDDNFFAMVRRKMFQSVKDLLRESDDETIGDQESSFFKFDSELKSNLSDAETKAKRYFQYCTNVEEKKIDGMNPAIEYLTDFMNDSIPTSFSYLNEPKYVKFLRELWSFGVTPLYEFQYNWDSYDLDVGSVGLKWNITEESDELQMLERQRNLAYVKKVLELYEVDATKIPELSAEIVEFDRTLANISSLAKSLPRPIKRLTWGEAMARYRHFNWQVYRYVSTDDYNKKKIYFNELHFKNLNDILESHSDTELSNYFQFRLAQVLLNFTSEFEGTQEELEEFCLQPLKKYMDTALSALALRRFLSQPIEVDITEMLKSVDKEFINYVSNLDHLTEDVKESLIEKANKTLFKLGVNEILDLVSHMKNKYWNLYIRSERYFANGVEMKKFTTRIDSNHDSSFHGVLKVNAFYKAHNSERMFPLGFMLPTAYHTHFPKWINYGNFGSTIGHELTHAFDTDGFFYKAGQTERQPFNLSTILRHFKRTLCLARQYNAQGIDGIKTLSDNTADLGGLIISYEAYKKLLDENEEFTKSEQPQDLNFTSNQLFFVSYAQTYCDKVGIQNSDDAHAPKKYRAIGSILNLYQFSEAFHCPANSPMNPSKKCDFL